MGPYVVALAVLSALSAAAGLAALLCELCCCGPLPPRRAVSFSRVVYVRGTSGDSVGGMDSGVSCVGNSDDSDTSDSETTVLSLLAP
ncbi:hypothetical protein EMCLV027L [Equine molluscum contagiosum-like virus]|nr:hypothetical protein EMCLV027L [Equine molluscum contagiosum-like virus]